MECQQGFERCSCDRNSSTTRCTARCGWQLARHQEFWANFKCTVNFGSKLTILLRPCQSSAIRPACLWNDPWHVRLKVLQSVGAWSNRALAFMTLLVSSWLRVRLDAVFLGNTCYHWLSFKNILHSKQQREKRLQFVFIVTIQVVVDCCRNINSVASSDLPVFDLPVS